MVQAGGGGSAKSTWSVVHGHDSFFEGCGAGWALLKGQRRVGRSLFRLYVNLDTDPWMTSSSRTNLRSSALPTELYQGSGFRAYLSFSMLYALISSFLLLLLGLLPVAAASSIVLDVQPISDSSLVPSTPVSQVQIEYDASKSTASVISYSPPTSFTSSLPYLRIGLSDPETGHWRGIVTDAATFTDQYKKKFVLHLDDSGAVYHIGLTTDIRTKSKEEDEVEVELVQRRAGPKPVLNAPVALTPEGKLGGQEPEKTFLQKYVILLLLFINQLFCITYINFSLRYWWALLLFVAVQFLAGGGDK